MEKERAHNSISNMDANGKDDTFYGEVISLPKKKIMALAQFCFLLGT